MKKHLYTVDIDDLNYIQSIDKHHALESIQFFSKQIKHTWEQLAKIKIKPVKKIDNVIIAGMGGSGLGADVIKHVYKQQLQIPLEIVNDYTLPHYTNENTLVILSSYSGNTEEVLSCAKEAKQKKAQIAVITAGGKLATIAQKNKYPSFIFDPKYNPSEQPRLAIGYAVTGLLGLLAKLGIIKFTQKEVNEIIKVIDQVRKKVDIDIESKNNEAKKLAFQLFDKKPILVAAEFLKGSIHVSTNQMNENSKTFADYKIIPEINHHLMEGLKFPESNRYTLIFVLFNSKLYHPRNQKRMDLTRQVIETNNIESAQIDLKAKTKLTQAFESMTIMAFAHFYLAILYHIDPFFIPYVDWFKEQL